MTLVFAIALVLSVGLILLIIPLAQRIGLVDNPGGRKQHGHATPMVGGIALFLAFMLSILTLDVPLGAWRTLFMGSTLVFITGLLDDFRETPPSARFVAQIGAALIIVIWGNVRLENLGFLVSTGQEIELGWVAIPFSVFCIVGIINATNMMDGLDGLSGGILLMVFSVLLVVAWQAGLFHETLILAIVCGVLTGFLLLNFRFADNRPAAVFLGDAGTMFLGLLVAWFLIRFTQAPVAKLRPITAVWLFGLPIMDTVAIMVRRMRRGRSPFAPDREHLHHILLLAGFTVRRTALTMLGISLLLGAVGLAGEWLNLPESYMFYGFLLVFAVYYLGMSQAWKLMKALRKVHNPVLTKAPLEDSPGV